MPSAATPKPEKQASSEAQEPIKQGIVFVEHKIRNLGKKKARLDSYQELQASGKELDADQKQALKKYDELCQNLLFAQELSKQLNNISVESQKLQKKKEKKEAREREQQEAAKVKEILIIQDILASMGSDSVRDDFLAGRNRACKLTEAELGYLDELFGEVSPKREPEEGQPPFLEQAGNAAKHLLSIIDGKDKEIVGTKYSVLKDLIEKINNCGYFDPVSAQEPAPQEVAEPPAPVVEQTEPVHQEMVETEIEDPIAPAVYQSTGQPVDVELPPVVAPVVETAGLYISQRPMADVLTNVMGTGPSTFNFIQESELEAPEVGVAPAGGPQALPIPTQTFTNANFSPPQEAVYTAQQTQFNQTQSQITPAPAPAQTFEPPAYQNQTSQGGTGDWNDTNTEQNDWAMPVEQSDQNRWTEPSQPSDEWNDNDGFQTAGRGGGRGGRGRGGGDRGRGGPRGGRGNYQNGRGGYNNQNGRGGYNRNSEGGYQNGYQSRDGERGSYRGNRDFREGGGQRRGGPRGGGQDRGGPRGGPRGGGGNRGTGNYRGGNRGDRQ